MDTTHLIGRVRASETIPPPEERRSIRERSRASKAACAKVLGVTPQAFAYWESGERTPRGDSLAEYARLLAELQQAVAA
jgi:DNA-binding transcriptional regulator YiaG